MTIDDLTIYLRFNEDLRFDDCMKQDSKIYVAGHRGMVGSAIVRELERQQPSLEFPPEGFTPEVACRDEIMDRRFMGIIPYVRFVGKRAEDGAFPYDGADRYRFRLEIDRRFPLEVNQIAMLKECFLSLLDYVYNQMNNPTGKTRMRL